MFQLIGNGGYAVSVRVCAAKPRQVLLNKHVCLHISLELAIPLTVLFFGVLVLVRGDMVGIDMHYRSVLLLVYRSR